MPHQTELTGEMRECIQDCLDCARMATETVTHCLLLGGRYAEASHIRNLLDCAESCATSAGFLLRASQYHARMCDVSAEVCRASADSCQALAGDDDTLLRCAETARRTAESCRRISMAMA